MNFKDMIQKYRKPSKKGFSLVELIVVVCIVSIVSGATLTVFLMVQDVTRDASDIVIDQYNTTQMERLIRNELQVASNVDITTSTYYKKVGGMYAPGVTVEENDEYIMYDETANRVVFMRADNSQNFQTVFSISDVEDIEITLAPLDNTKTEKKGQPYKMFYTITTLVQKNDTLERYKYSGGMVLGNTCYNTKGDTTFTMAYPVFGSQKTLKWEKGSADNQYIICFHRDITEVAPT